MHFALAAKLPVFHPQRALRKLGGHPEKPAQKQPERHPRPAALNADRHPGDVAQPHGPGHRRTQRLEMGHLTRISRQAVFSPHRPQRQPKRPDVDELERHRQDQTRRRQPKHHQLRLIGADRNLVENRVHKGPGYLAEPFVDPLVQGRLHDWRGRRQQRRTQRQQGQHHHHHPSRFS